MGATTFSDITGGKTARDAFNTAVHNAQYMSGHGGYTGTIAEKNDFVMVGYAATDAEALKMADEMIEACDSRVDDKWGPAGCIDIARGTSFLFFGWASC